MQAPPNAATIVGLLADDDRRVVAAALILGDSTLDEICARTDLAVAAAASALARLVSGGLVERGSDGAVHLLGAAFAYAAREAAQAKPTPASHEGSPDVVKVLNVYVRDGRLTQIPTVHSKRLIVLDHLVQEFEIGQRYSESMVNLLLAKWHPDTAALRRHMVDEGMLDREAGQYWRSGGSVAVGVSGAG
jgi:hypothetical protein